MNIALRILAGMTLASIIIYAWISIDLSGEGRWVKDVGTALLGIAVATLITPHNQQWLWRMSKWVMRKYSSKTDNSDVTVYKRGKYVVRPEVESSVSSLSQLRNVRYPELWVVSSGKGGVGKSFLSLGLAEYLSMRRPVLLVDFDLHNRGLTSLLKLNASGTESTAFNFLGEFRDMLQERDVESPCKGLLDATSTIPEDFSRKDFNLICQKFARECRLDRDVWDGFGQYSCIVPRFVSFGKDRQSRNTSNTRGGLGLEQSNVTFLPSRAHGDNFLLSEQSESSYIVVSLFLQAFCSWVKETMPATIVILDCHGAHDHLTAGAIVAADKLLVVTTPDPGSYDGTKELLDFVAGLREGSLPTVITLNICRSWDYRFPAADRAFRSYEKQLAIRGVRHLNYSAAVRDITANYKFGDVARNQLIWRQVCEIAELLKVNEERDNIGTVDLLVSGEEARNHEDGSEERNDRADVSAKSAKTIREELDRLKQRT